MRILKLKEIRISKIVMPGAFAQLKSGDHEVALRARSIARVGMIHEPLVRFEDMRLVSGLYRVAAHIALGRKKILVKLVDCTDEELAEIYWAENADRRHDPGERDGLVSARAKRMREQAEREQAQIRAKDELEDALDAAVGGPGFIPDNSRPRLLETPARYIRRKPGLLRAIEHQSAEDGVSPVVTRHRFYKKASAEYRRVRNYLMRMKPGDALMVTAPTDFDNLGVPQSEEFDTVVANVQVMVRYALAHLMSAYNSFARMRTLDLQMSERRIAATMEAIAAIRADIKDGLPAAICPWCKGQDGIQQKCRACEAMGWVGPKALKAAPKELVDPREPMVSMGGQLARIDASSDDHSAKDA